MYSNMTRLLAFLVSDDLYVHIPIILSLKYHQIISLKTEPKAIIQGLASYKVSPRSVATALFAL